MRQSNAETQRKYRKGLHSNKGEPIMQIFLDVTYVADLSKDIVERKENEERLAYKAQHALRRWWSGLCPKKHLIIVTVGNVNKARGETTLTVELYQLNLQEDEISIFKTGAAQVIGEVIEDFGW